MTSRSQYYAGSDNLCGWRKRDSPSIRPIRRTRFCATCADYTLVKGFILRDECAGGVYFAALHDHDGPEAWIDVIVSTFERADFSDHVTFGYRIRDYQ